MKKLEGGGDSNPADNFRIKANETFYVILTHNTQKTEYNSAFYML